MPPISEILSYMTPPLFELFVSDVAIVSEAFDYNRELTSLFMETDRHNGNGEGNGDVTKATKSGRAIYQTTALKMRQRLQLHGFTVAYAYTEMERFAIAYAAEPNRYRRFKPNEERPKSQMFLEGYEREVHELLDSFGVSPFRLHPLDLGERFISRRIGVRLYLRFILEYVSDDTLVSLHISNHIVHRVVGPSGSIVQRARAEQLTRLPADAPLIVLTEGVTDSRLLSAAMQITHPHLVGFINFIDFSAHPAEGSVSALAKTVYTFAAAGVANRYLALADNDTAAHSALAKVKADKNLPDTCRILHYPNLEMLTCYPTLGPYSRDVVMANINGRAGSLELYLGEDVLKVDGTNLAPVQWQSYDDKLRRYQGALSGFDKKWIQKAFEAKIKSALSTDGTLPGDWVGVRAIMNCIIAAFDDSEQSGDPPTAIGS